mgnify:CR=1 FL=1
MAWRVIGRRNDGTANEWIFDNESDAREFFNTVCYHDMVRVWLCERTAHAWHNIAHWITQL